MKAEHLKSWLQEATREKDLETEAWGKVASVTQVAFWGGFVPEAMMWKTMVLILKGDRGYRGMGMVEATRKICTSIMSSRLQSSILIHDALH